MDIKCRYVNKKGDMMNSIILKIFISSVIVLSATVGYSETDQEIERCINRVFRSIHGDIGYVDGALEACEYNSNRFVRILFNMVTNYPEHASFYLGYIGDYGTTNDVPFLENYVTNIECGYNACNSILRLSGLNSNSLHCASMYHSLTNQTGWENYLFNVIVRMSNRANVSEEGKSMGMEYAWNYASNTTSRVSFMDLTFKVHSPSYTNGTTRSDFLNYKLTQDISARDYNYITNVLEHIQAEPAWIPNPY